ncbi:MAG: DNA adenine methylase [Anaerolineae bacterium]
MRLKGLKPSIPISDMNYIGSKHSLLPFLEQHILDFVDLEDATFFDIFAGTGAVGRHFKRFGGRIVANDIQHYSYCLNRAYVGLNEEPGFAALVDGLPGAARREPVEAVLAYLNDLPGVEGFVYRHYCPGGSAGSPYPRRYYTDANGRRCDAIRLQIQAWFEAGRITEDEYFYLLACLIEAIDKVANTASVYGAFLKRIKKSARKPLALQPLDLVSSPRRHVVYNRDGEELVGQVDCDVLYIDPPYNQRQYCTNYHVLETISRYDRPQLSGVTGLRDYSAQKSNFCRRDKALEALDRLLRLTPARHVFLSYNNEGLMPQEDICAVMRRYGQVTLRRREYGRFRADIDRENRRYKADRVVEYLFCLSKTSGP